MIRFADYIQVPFEALKTVVDNVYLNNPQAVADKVSEYAVIAPSNYVSNREMDTSGEFDHYVTSVTIALFVRDKKTSKATGQMNILKIDALLKKVLALFPIADKEKNVKVNRPRVTLSTSDGDGWHYTIITARLTTYF